LGGTGIEQTNNIGVHLERFNLRNLNEVEGKEQSSVFDVRLFRENLRHWVDINRAWETIRENIQNFSQKESVGYHELKHKPWFDDGCSEL
jgi:hypothetical protein